MSSAPMANNAENIPVFILAGGLGSRLSEETYAKPKPMVEIGESPILLHIMRYYYSYGFNDFVICAGYRSWEIKNYFLSYQFRSDHLSIDHRTELANAPRSFGSTSGMEKWRVRVIDTGLNCSTGGRLARAFDEISGDQKIDDFAVTYGDGVSDVDLSRELGFHAKHGDLGTVLGVRPVARFGNLTVDPDGKVTNFMEKSQAHVGLINGGFFFFKNGFREYLDLDDECILEQAPLSKLASDQQLRVFEHTGFWHPMDTLRDKNQLAELWESGKAPWNRR
jgi:glucose-1-phosphate cytidylyltransferase